MIGALGNWLDHRIGYRKMVSAMLLEHIPGGAKWRYVWGSCLAFVFMIQLITGLMLMLSYSPGDSSAWGSVYFIQYEMDFGWLIRGLHHFGSQTMVVLLGLHVLQVVIAGAQLPPREINWWLGLGLMGVVFGMSLTGYLLPWDQKGYYATTVATNIASSIPGIGDYLQRIVVGGPEYGNHTLTHFFTLHVGILPAVFVVLLIAHLYVFRRHGVTAPANAKGMDFFWPAQAFRDLMACMVVFGVMLSLVVFGKHGNEVKMGLDPERDNLGVELESADGKVRIKKVVEAGPAERAELKVGDVITHVDGVKVFTMDAVINNVIRHEPGEEVSLKILRGKDPREIKVTLNNLSLYEDWARAGRKGCGANLDAPADRETQGYPARPEWYFLFLFQLLKYFEGEQMLIGTVYIPNGVIVVLILLPLLGYGVMRKFGHFVGIFVVVALLAAVAVLTLLAIADDAAEPIPLLGVRAGDKVLGLGPDDEKAVKKARENAAKFQYDREQAEKEARRAIELAHFGIPEEGARLLLRNDPLTRGPKIFQIKCAGCHAHPDEPVERELVWDAASENYVMKTKGKARKTASDLGGFGSEKWIRGLLDNPASPKYFGLAKKTVKDFEGKDEVLELRGMIGWRQKLDRKRKGLDKEEIAQQEKDFDLIAQVLADQSRPPHERDKSLNAKVLDDAQCLTCHGFHGRGKGTAPDLTDYGSQAWIRSMIMSPAQPARHGRLNLMPAFRTAEGPGASLALQEYKEATAKYDFDGFLKTLSETKFKEYKDPDEFREALAKYRKEIYPRTEIVELSDVDREILIRWLTNDNRVVFGGQVISGPVVGKK